MPITLARFDQATWDGDAVLAAPTTDAAAYGTVRAALLWRGDLKPAPPTGPYDRWPQPTPTTSTTTEDPQ